MKKKSGDFRNTGIIAISILENNVNFVFYEMIILIQVVQLVQWGCGVLTWVEWRSTPLGYKSRL